MEFPEGRGGSILGTDFGKSRGGGEGRGHRKNPFRGGYRYFLELNHGQMRDVFVEKYKVRSF